MDKEKFRLHCSISRIETALFISIIHMEDWIREQRLAKYEIESRAQKIRSLISKSSFECLLKDDRDCENISNKTMEEVLSKLVSLKNNVDKELIELGSRYPSLEKNCRLEIDLLTTRIELEFSKVNELGELGEKYGKSILKSGRICWIADWGSARRALHHDSRIFHRK